jgi:putative transcriptional regulator
VKQYEEWPRATGIAGAVTHDVRTVMSLNHPNRLREHREAAGHTQQRLADLVGASRVTIVRAEIGRQAPSLDLALRLAHALDTTVEQLFGDDAEARS